MVRRSKVHFVHCLLPKAETVGGGDVRVTHGESPDSGLMTLDVGLLRAQLRGSKLLDALRIYRQGNKAMWKNMHIYDIFSSLEMKFSSLLAVVVMTNSLPSYCLWFSTHCCILCQINIALLLCPEKSKLSDVDLTSVFWWSLLCCAPSFPTGYPDHMVFSEFRRRFDVLAPHLTKKHGRHYIVTDEKRVSDQQCCCLLPGFVVFY